MISVFLLHHSGREFTLQFPEADAFRTVHDQHYQILAKDQVIGEVPVEHTMYIGNSALHVGPQVTPPGSDA